MKIKIIENPLIQEVEIHILCKENNEYIRTLAEGFAEKQVTITGRIENEYVKIPSRDIYYFESVDNRTYIYCEKNVYQSNMKLYDVIEIIIIILLTYGISILSLYLNSRNDAEYINKILKEHR